MDYLQLNKHLWNLSAEHHPKTAFYDMDTFRKTRNSLMPPELELLGDLKGKKVLHLQCHFGQDTLSLAALGAEVTGVDLSDKAIEVARGLADELGLKARFICSDVRKLDQVLQERFDIIFTSYGVLIWLPDLRPWARIVGRFLQPGGKLILVEFHPVFYVTKEDGSGFEYSYFGGKPIVEESTGTYADPEAGHISGKTVTWDHSFDEIFNSLWEAGLDIRGFREYDYSPYRLGEHMVQTENGYQYKGLEGKLPLIYSLSAYAPSV